MVGCLSRQVLSTTNNILEGVAMSSSAKSTKAKRSIRDMGKAKRRAVKSRKKINKLRKNPNILYLG